MSVAQDRITTARDELDAHVRDIVRWHFDPATGCPFWLDYAQKLDFDPREKIQSYEGTRPDCILQCLSNVLCKFHQTVRQYFYFWSLLW